MNPSHPSSNTQNQNDETYDINIRELINILLRRRHIIIGSAIIATLIAILFLMFTPSRYTGTALLQVSGHNSNVVDIESVVSGISGDESAILSELDILESHDLAEQVVLELNLMNDDEFVSSSGVIASWYNTNTLSDEEKEDNQQLLIQRAGQSLLSKLEVSRKPRSYTISLSFTSQSAEKAALIANTYTEQYLIRQLNTKFAETKRANNWLNEKLEDLQKNLRQSELAVEAFREKHGLLESSAGVTLTDQQLSELNTQLILARTERAQAEARLKGAKNAIHSSGEVLNSNLIQRLREQEAEVLRKKSDLSNRYGTRHPKMVNVNAELRDLRSKIQIEISKIQQGLQTNVEIARSRETELEKSLRQLEGKAGSSNKDSVQLAQLVRERDANKLLYESFLGRFKETSQNQDLEQADARIISQAQVPLKPSFPRKGIILMIAIIFGTGLGIMLAFLFEQLDNAFKTTDQLEKTTHTPSVGMIPELPAKTNLIEYASTKLSSVFAESLRSVLTSLHFSNPDHPPKIVMVTSTIPQEGKSSFSASLATVLAKSGAKVLLVDCDLKRPALGKILGIQKTTHGLSELLAGDATEKEVIRLDKRSGLHFITSNPNTVHSQDLLASKKMNDFLQAAAKKYDMVILDTPPVMAVSDALVLSGKVDAALFMVRWDKTPRPLVKAALKQLHACNIPLAGTVLNRVNLEKHARYGYSDRGYYYGRYKEYYTQ